MTNSEVKEMSIWDHLNELRSRLFKAIIALAITSAVSFAAAQTIIGILLEPIGGVSKVQSIEVTENISVFMKVSLLSGFVLAMPVIVYQLLMFILPGLTGTEKKWIYIAVPFASLLFLGGVLFAYVVMLPAALSFMISFLGINTVPRPSNYISFITNLMFWIGISFETPLLIFILAKYKVVTYIQLARQWRYAVVVIALIAAVVTPTVDPINMSLLMVPLFLLYLLSILLAMFAR
jgi:sec-independent protein translocase protein TatC